jgi:glycosyltransferase involved in cell wall biosynthesis
MPYLTILTPTYNRANTLMKCFESLCQQTFQDFQWLIIDDGSTDGTGTLINEIKQREHKFHIDYYYKPNGGKHTAINYAHKYISGDIVLILDSDDYLTEDAASTIKYYWDKYNNDKTLCGLSFLKVKIDGSEYRTVGSEYPFDEYRSNYISCRINENVEGDKCEIIRSELLRKYPFPVLGEERFLGEGYLWASVARDYDTIYINKGIYVCEYLEDGLTMSGRKMRISNPLGGMLHAKTYFNSKIKLSLKIKNAWLYIAYGFFAKRKLLDMLRESNNAFLIFINFPFGYGLYLLWRKKYLSSF